MTTTVLVTTVSTPNLDDATSLQRILEHLEQTDDELRSELAALDHDVQVTTTLLNIADVLEKVKSLAPAIAERPSAGQNGLVAANGNGHAAVYSNGLNGSQLHPGPAETEGEKTPNTLMSLEKMLEQIQQGKLELYLHLAPEPKPAGSEPFAEEEEIGQHFLQNPYLY